MRQGTESEVSMTIRQAILESALVIVAAVFGWKYAK